MSFLDLYTEAYNMLQLYQRGVEQPLEGGVIQEGEEFQVEFYVWNRFNEDILEGFPKMPRIKLPSFKNVSLDIKGTACAEVAGGNQVIDFGSVGPGRISLEKVKFKALKALADIFGINPREPYATVVLSADLDLQDFLRIEKMPVTFATQIAKN